VHYGRPAAERLHAVVASAKGGDPLTPVTVVVPSNGVGVAAHGDPGGHLQDCQIPLLDHCQLHNHGRQCQALEEPACKDQPEPHKHQARATWEPVPHERNPDGS
jgi:hypothetical protein